MKALAFALLLSFPALALATGVEVGLIIGALSAVSWYAWVQIAMIAYSVYSSSQARKNAKNKQNAARAAFNSSLTDRNITALTAIPPLRIVYGEVIVGGDIVGIFGSDSTKYRLDGTTWQKPDGLKHLVIVLAAHQVEAIGEVYIGGIPLGALDGSGYTTTGEFMSVEDQNRQISLAPGGTFSTAGLGNGAITVLNSVDEVLSTNGGGDNGFNYVAGTFTLTVSNTLLTNTGGNQTNFSITFSASFPRVKVDKHLGTDSQTVDTYLNSVAPLQWTSAHRLRGLAYIVLTIDLDEARFQGGPPPVAVSVKGKLLFDTRDSGTRWSDNNALCARDYLVSTPLGWGVPSASIDTTFCNAAANACDALVPLVDFSTANNNFHFNTDADLEGWTSSGMTSFTVAAGELTADSAGAAAQIIRNNLSPTIAGTTFRAIRARLKRTAGSGWVGSAFYDNTTHGFSASFVKTIAAPTFDPVTGWAEATWDMTTLTVGGADWTTSTIRHIRLDLAASAADTFVIDWISVQLLNGKMYTFNGAMTMDDGKEAALDLMAESMAGQISYGATWQIAAGVWVAPVMDLGDDDLDGQIAFAQTDTPIEDLFNGVRGTIIPFGSQAPIDFDPYQNAAYVTDDGGALWTTIALPFTNNKGRARNIARIKTELERGGQVITYPAKLKAWPLQIGDRVRVSSTEYGLVLKTYRVTDWQFGNTTSVNLTLQEDVAPTYDLADAPSGDQSPNTNLPNPWVVPLVAGLSAASGTTHLLRSQDGTIITRVKVSWTATTSSYVADGLGVVRIEWRRQWADTGNAIQIVDVPGDSTSAYLAGMADGEAITIGARFINSIGVKGPPFFISHNVIGKSAPPGNVAGLTNTIVQGGARISWSDLADVDYESTELRHGASWAAGTFLFRGNARNWTWLSPAQATYTVRAKHYDTSGNESTTDQTTSVVIDAAALIIIGAAQLNAVVGGDNHITNASFEQDSNLDGLADGWTVFTGGAGDPTRTHTLTRPTAQRTHGTYSQEVLISGGVVVSTDSGISSAFTFPVLPSTLYTLSVDLWSNVASKTYALCRTLNSGGTGVGDFSTTVVVPTGQWVRKVLTFTTPATAVKAEMHVRGITLATELFRVDSFMLQLGDVATQFAPRTDELLPTYFGPQFGGTPGVVLGGGNVVANSSFEQWTGIGDGPPQVGGLGVGWTTYAAGITGTITRTIVLTGGFNNGKYQRVVAAGLGTTSADNAGVSQTTIRCDGWAGLSFVLSASIRGDVTGLPQARLQVDWYNSTPTYLSSSTLSTSITTGFIRYILNGVVPATAVRADVFLFMQSRPSAAGASAIEFDAVQLELGSVPTAYRAKAGEELVRRATTGQALNFDPDCTSEDEWGGGHPLIASGIATGITGSTALHSPDIGTDNHVYSPFARSVPVDRLKAYRVSALVRKGGGASAGTMHLGIMGWSAAGVDQRGVGSPAVPYYTLYSVAVTALTTAFVRHTVTISQATIAAMQAGVVFIGPHCILGYNAGTINGWVEMQDVRLEEVAATATIDDGSVTDAKLVTINADRINVGSLRGISVVAAMIGSKGSYFTTTVNAADTTVNVKDTSDFHATSGTAIVIDATNDGDQFTYTGKTATTLTGCSGVLAHTIQASVGPLINNGVNQQFMMSDQPTGNTRWYANGTQIAAIGKVFGSASYDSILAQDASAQFNGTSGFGVLATMTTGQAIIGSATTTGIGVTGNCDDTGVGVQAFSSNGYPLTCDMNQAKKGHARWVPKAGLPVTLLAGDLCLAYTTGGAGAGTRNATPRLLIADGTNWRYVDQTGNIFTG